MKKHRSLQKLTAAAGTGALAWPAARMAAEHEADASDLPIVFRFAGESPWRFTLFRAGIIDGSGNDGKRSRSLGVVMADTRRMRRGCRGRAISRMA